MDYYLFSGTLYWTMTPDANSGNFAVVVIVGYDGGLGGVIVAYFFDDSVIRPVVSLNSDAISGGSGTMIDPFVVG